MSYPVTLHSPNVNVCETSRSLTFLYACSRFFKFFLVFTSFVLLTYMWITILPCHTYTTTSKSRRSGTSTMNWPIVLYLLYISINFAKMEWTQWTMGTPNYSAQYVKLYKLINMVDPWGTAWRRNTIIPDAGAGCDHDEWWCNAVYHLYCM